MYVKEVAKRLGVSPDTVRYYVRIGIAEPERNSENGYRMYGRSDLAKLRFCIRARNLGFSLENIQEILNEAHEGHSPCPRAREIIAERLSEIEISFLETEKLFKRISSAAAAWNSMPDKEPTANMICSLIETWDDKADEVSSEMPPTQ